MLLKQTVLVPIDFHCMGKKHISQISFVCSTENSHTVSLLIFFLHIKLYKLMYYKQILINWTME